MERFDFRRFLCIFIYTLFCLSIFSLICLIIQFQPHDRLDACSYANGIQLGAYSIALLIVTGLFLISIYYKQIDWLLLLLMFSLFHLATYRVIYQYGQDIVPRFIYSIYRWEGTRYISSHSILLYLLLNQEKAFWKCFSQVLKYLCSSVLLGYFISLVFHGQFATYINENVGYIFKEGSNEMLLQWITIVLVFTCTGIVVYYYTHILTHGYVHDTNLAIRNETICNNYHLLEALMEDGATSQNISTDTNTKNNKVIDTLLHSYSCYAGKMKIGFDTYLSITSPFTIPEDDLCILLTELLDNAFAASLKINDPLKRCVQLTINYQDGLLSILCTNHFDNTLLNDLSDQMSTTKVRPNHQGLGIDQMKQIAKKYHSNLSILVEDSNFTVQTALKLSDEPSSNA